MTETEALVKMISPGMRRPNAYRNGIIQIHVTRACDKACLSCTQGSQLGGKTEFITPELFEQAVLSLKDYFGVAGCFGGNPALHPRFELLCDILAKHIPFERRGLWCNHPRGKGAVMRRTFDPAHSNINVHLDQAAYDEFRRDWPEARPFGLKEDSRHSPPYVAMQDVIPDEGKRWELIADCDINRNWSAMLCVFRGELRGFFCEIAGAQAMLHQHEPDYPDTGVAIPFEDPITGKTLDWWRLPMVDFAHQVRHHCHGCGIPLRGYGELAQSTTGKEQVTATHASVFKPKRAGREVQTVTELVQLGSKHLKVTDYIGGAKK